MKNLIGVLVLFGNIVFFSVMGLLGIEYQGAEDSNIYWVYNVFITSVGSLYFIKYILYSKVRFSKNEFILFLIPVFIVFVYLLNILFLGYPSEAESRWFIFYVLWSIPAFYLGFTFANSRTSKNLFKWIELIAVLISLSTMVSILFPFLKGTRVLGIGGATYQTASYISALGFGLTMFFLMFGDTQGRFKFTNYRVYRIILMILAIANLMSALISGGKGAFVLIVVYSIFLFLNSVRSKKLTSTIKYIFIFIGIFLIANAFSDNTNFIAGFNRATQFISFETGINWDGASGRDRVFNNALYLIKAKPLLGYGLFSYWRVTSNPHNLILEVLLGGGLIYFLLFVTFVIRLLSKVKYVILNEKKYRVWIILLIYPTIMLMFSGSYLVSSILWFATSQFLFYKESSENMTNELVEIRHK